jgi:hypothetical protein
VRIQFPIFVILEKVTDKDFYKSKNLTFEIHNTLRILKVLIGDKGNIQKKMRLAVKDILLDNGITTDINEIASRIIERLKVHPD